MRYGMTKIQVLHVMHDYKIDNNKKGLFDSIK